MERHYQCSLVRNDNGNKIHTTTWLPEKFAKCGKYLKLQDQAGTWVDGWLVTGVSGPGLESKFVSERSRDWKNHRSMTDI